MNYTKIYDYYSFGYNYNNLLKGDINKTNSQCLADLKIYNNFIRHHDLRVTISSIQLSHLVPEMEKLKKLANAKKTKDQIIDPKFWNSIIEKLKKVDTTFDAELNTKIAFTLEEKRYSNETLLDKIYQLFGENTFGVLPSIAKFDFEESGKCLAFDRYTASAFHSLRGTEDVVKMYYERLFSITANDKDTWGTYENKIKKELDDGKLIPSPDEQLIISMASLRKYYRNQTQHPQMIYSSDQSQDILSNCIKVVIDIVVDLKSRNLI